jgi:V8-like Glu-specific endopeptidase
MDTSTMIVARAARGGRSRELAPSRIARAAGAFGLLLVLITSAATVRATGSTKLRPKVAPEGPAIENTQEQSEDGAIVISNPGFLDTTGRAKRSSASGLVPVVAGKASSLEPLGSLAPAVVADRERIAEIGTWNASGALLKEGFSREIVPVRPVTIDESSLESLSGDGRITGGLLAKATGDMLAWTGHVRVADAHRVRVHLANVQLPPGSFVWAYGDDGIAQGPVAASVATREDGLWCPSVRGGSVWIEVQVPVSSLARGGSCSFAIDRALEIFELDESGQPAVLTADKVRGDTSCLVDVNCVDTSTAIANASKGIGRMFFVSNGSGFVCTGGLVNDRGNSGTPYFLTANHCMHTQPEAASLEVWFDFKRVGCNGVVPNDSTLPKSFGGTFLVAGAGSDFSFIELTDLPAGRFFFGWMVGDPGKETLYRIANPGGGPQSYSETRSRGTKGAKCQNLPGADYIYQERITGGIIGGSSGSPVWFGNNFIVGQLFGTCGVTGSTSCDSTTSTVDGRFSRTFSGLSSFLTPNSPTIPTNLRASNIKKKKLQLDWSDNATDETSYEIALFRNDAYQTLGSLPVNSKTVIVKTLTPATTYRLAIRACRNNACSAYSEVIVTTKGS